jgi:hypothetical protein
LGLTDHEQRVVRAIGQALFPRDRTIDVDADDVDLVAWVTDYLWRMPPASRTQVRALLRTFDAGYAAWAVRPGASFSKARPAEQAEYIASWSESTTYVQRMLFEALWTVFAFGYVEQAEAQGHVGQGAHPTPPPGVAADELEARSEASAKAEKTA